MVRVAWCVIGALQLGIVLLVLFVAAQGRVPIPAGLDRSGLGQVAARAAREADPQTTGSIGRSTREPERPRFR